MPSRPEDAESFQQPLDRGRCVHAPTLPVNRSSGSRLFPEPVWYPAVFTFVGLATGGRARSRVLVDGAELPPNAPALVG